MDLAPHPPTDPRYGCPWLTWSTAEPIDVLSWPERVRGEIRDPVDRLLPLELLMFRRPGSETLLVHLHGSLDRAKYELPRFERVASLVDLPHHQLWLADPTLHLGPGLRIGWYSGGARENSTERLAHLINDVAEQLGVGRVLIQGASAGGFGALALTTMVPRSLALAFSPQTNMGRFSQGRPASSLISADRSGYSGYAEFEEAEPERADLGALYRSRQGGRAWYVQNTGDLDHVEAQMQPFQAVADDRVTFVSEHHCAGHNPPTTPRVRAWVEHALENFDGDPRPFALGAPRRGTPGPVPVHEPAAPTSGGPRPSADADHGEHPHYKCPVVRLGRPDDFDPRPGDPERIYLVDIGDGMELAFITRPALNDDRVTRVGFHAAKTATQPDGIFFQPLDQARRSGQAYVLFADPTLTLNPGNRLSWYLGTPGVDPDDTMEIITRRVMGAARSPYLLVEGSSGGGFVSLRFASRFHNAVAVPKVPQTDLFLWTPGPLRATLSLAWQGWSYDRILAERPERFRIMDRYTDSRWNRANLVHYVQNVGDENHVQKHLHPMLAEFGATPDAYQALGGRFQVSRPYTGQGHRALPAATWTAENAVALSWLKAQRPAAASERAENPFTKPAGHVQDRGSPSARRRNITQHLDGNRFTL